MKKKKSTLKDLINAANYLPLGKKEECHAKLDEEGPEAICLVLDQLGIEYGYSRYFIHLEDVDLSQSFIERILKNCWSDVDN